MSWSAHPLVRESGYDSLGAVPTYAGYLDYRHVSPLLPVDKFPQRQQHLTHVRHGCALVVGGVPRQLFGFSA